MVTTRGLGVAALWARVIVAAGIRALLTVGAAGVARSMGSLRLRGMAAGVAASTDSLRFGGMIKNVARIWEEKTRSDRTSCH